MEHLSNDFGNDSNQHKNSHNQCNETGHPLLSLMESYWKLKQTHIFQWREYSNGGKAIVEQILVPEEGKKSKRAQM